MTFRKWDEYESGDTVTGEFVGTHVDQFKKTNYKIKVLDAQFSQDQDAAEALIGKVLVLNSAGSLDKQMTEVVEGDCIQMEYTGKTLLTKGPFAGKEAHGMIVSLVEMQDESAESAL